MKSESESTGATDSSYKADKMALIEEAIAEAELDKTEGAELLSGDKIETYDTRYKHVIHLEAQVQTAENM